MQPGGPTVGLRGSFSARFCNGAAATGPAAGLPLSGAAVLLLGNGLLFRHYRLLRHNRLRFCRCGLLFRGSINVPGNLHHAFWACSWHDEDRGEGRGAANRWPEKDEPEGDRPSGLCPVGGRATPPELARTFFEDIRWDSKPSSERLRLATAQRTSFKP